MLPFAAAPLAMKLGLTFEETVAASMVQELSWPYDCSCVGSSIVMGAACSWCMGAYERIPDICVDNAMFVCLEIFSYSSNVF